MRSIRLMLFVFLVLFIPSCGGVTSETILRDATVVSNGAAVTIESAQGVAEILYKGEQEATLDEAVRAGKTKEEARAALQAVRDRWKPVWGAFAKARDVHAKLATVVAGGDDVAQAVSLVGELGGLQNQIAKFMSEARARLNKEIQ